MNPIEVNRRRVKLKGAIATICLVLLVMLAVKSQQRDTAKGSPAVPDGISKMLASDPSKETTDPVSRRPGKAARQREARSFETFLKGIQSKTDFETVSDGYFKAWLLGRDGAQLWEGGDDDAAYASLLACRDAYAYYLGVREKDPDWKTDMVELRLAIARRQLEGYYEAYHHGTVPVSPEEASKEGKLEWLTSGRIPDGVVGFSFVSSDSGLAVSSVFTGSPADQAGLREGDEVLEVAGIPTGGLEMDALLGLLKGSPGEPLKITVCKKDGEEVQKLELDRMSGSELAVTIIESAGEADSDRLGE